MDKLVVCFLLWIDFSSSYQLLPVKRWSSELKTGFHRRVAADPSFVSKSITEVLLAAGTQFTAEWNRRGASRLLPEIDFIVPAILTAIFGYVCVSKRISQTKIIHISLTSSILCSRTTTRTANTTGKEYCLRNPGISRVYVKFLGPADFHCCSKPIPLGK